MLIEFIASDLYVCFSFAKPPLQVLTLLERTLCLHERLEEDFFFEKMVLFKTLDLKLGLNSRTIRQEPKEE